LRVNFEKASVFSRNAQLVMLAEKYIGETTSKVYEAVLRSQERVISRCWDDLETSAELQGIEEPAPQHEWVSTAHILKHLDPSVKLEDDLNYLPQTTLTNGINGINGHASPSSSEDDDDPPDRISLLEKHLNLLVNNPRPFLQAVRRGSYTVPYKTLTRFFIQNTIEQHVTARFGTMATRIIRILDKHGAQDEKFLAQMGILKPKETRTLSNILLKSGFIYTQEVPRDANRTTNRILWLYAYDPRRVRQQLLRDTYVAMRNLLQRISTEKRSFERVLKKAEQNDGSEETRLNETEMEQVKVFRAREERLLAMLGRLDDFASSIGNEVSPLEDISVGSAVADMSARVE
jgi:DNA-directed RNA polymerase III subunit RPC3